ncbi:iron-containing alcohol dehydrogenase [Sporosarcina luteola]|uniref:iron-containing alcohol dehydrogenase n=1 Tax=Sporosarcina luteola TaxID=582850 RepID=UPI00203AA34C|nr:iron-containing alcohol dehydrogenase [Sporosarcina luteola]MCM3636573.1 iron-containing alcohol dehydrogenase [Sporosarcina luteola]
MQFEFGLSTKILCGEGKHLQLGQLIKELTASNKTVIVTDQGVIEAGVVNLVERVLKESDIDYSVFSDLESDPSVRSIDAAARVIQDFDADCVIGIGGGSAMDVAKMASLVAVGEASASHYELMANPFPKKTITSIMIPTTSGSGAEVTSTVVFTNSEKRKVWGWDEQMAPDVAILDPLFTKGLPPHLTAATALDAFVHAIEACTGTRSNPIIEAFGLKSIELICGNLERVLHNPKDLEGRTALAVGAALAGVAIEHGGTGIAHCIGHAITTVGRVPHARAVAIAMNATYRWKVEGNVDMFAKVANAMGVHTEGLSKSEIAYAGADRFVELVNTSGLSTSLLEDGLCIDDVGRLVETMKAEENQPMRENNCRFVSEEDLRSFATELLSN